MKQGDEENEGSRHATRGPGSRGTRRPGPVWSRPRPAFIAEDENGPGRGLLGEIESALHHWAMAARIEPDPANWIEDGGVVTELRNGLDTLVYGLLGM